MYAKLNDDTTHKILDIIRTYETQNDINVDCVIAYGWYKNILKIDATEIVINMYDDNMQPLINNEYNARYTHIVYQVFNTLYNRYGGKK